MARCTTISASAPQRPAVGQTAARSAAVRASAGATARHGSRSLQPQQRHESGLVIGLHPCPPSCPALRESQPPSRMSSTTRRPRPMTGHYSRSRVPAPGHRSRHCRQLLMRASLPSSSAPVLSRRISRSCASAWCLSCPRVVGRWPGRRPCPGCLAAAPQQAAQLGLHGAGMPSSSGGATARTPESAGHRRRRPRLCQTAHASVGLPRRRVSLFHAGHVVAPGNKRESGSTAQPVRQRGCGQTAHRPRRPPRPAAVASACHHRARRSACIRSQAQVLMPTQRATAHLRCAPVLLHPDGKSRAGLPSFKGVDGLAIIDSSYGCIFRAQKRGHRDSPGSRADSLPSSSTLTCTCIGFELAAAKSPAARLRIAGSALSICSSGS